MINNETIVNSTELTNKCRFALVIAVAIGIYSILLYSEKH
jgi:hypothetical protein